MHRRVHGCGSTAAAELAEASSREAGAENRTVPAPLLISSPVQFNLIGQNQHVDGGRLVSTAWKPSAFP